MKRMILLVCCFFLQGCFSCVDLKTKEAVDETLVTQLSQREEFVCPQLNGMYSRQIIEQWMHDIFEEQYLFEKKFHQIRKKLESYSSHEVSLCPTWNFHNQLYLEFTMLYRDGRRSMVLFPDGSFECSEVYRLP